MTGKLTIIAAASAGYVLGARAGRGRSETIKSAAEDLWHNPTVQQTAAAAQDNVVAKAKKATPGHHV